MSGIHVDNASFCYQNGFKAIDGVSLAVAGGERLAILGQNGAGKTTLAKLMNNLLKPSKGNVCVGNKNTRGYTTAQIAREVGYVFQNPDDQIFHSTVIEEVAYGPRSALGLAEEESSRRCEEALKSVGLWERRDNNPFDLPLSVRKFVAIASIMAMDPAVYILDEPTAGQDIAGLATIERLVSELCGSGKAVITITHDIEFAASVFTRICVMCHGKLIKDGDVAEVFHDDDVMERARIKAPCAIRLARDLGLGKGVLTDEQLVAACVERQAATQLTTGPAPRATGEETHGI